MCEEKYAINIPGTNSKASVSDSTLKFFLLVITGITKAGIKDESCMIVKMVPVFPLKEHFGAIIVGYQLSIE